MVGGDREEVVAEIVQADIDDDSTASGSSRKRERE